MRNFRTFSFATMLCLGSAVSVQAQSQQHTDLASMDLDQLMKVQVTTVSKHAQTLSDVPAAIYVVTQDAIRRSGATNIPEALRGVPGVQVAQMDASKYVVSIRGMGSRYSDKLLVLVDGRSVYTSLFSGVYWDALDLDLALVDRIEVIRGPGGTLWGANAVNGIINIITKSSKDTLGTRVSLGSSTTEPFSVAASSGFQVPNGTVRFSAKGSRNDALSTSMNTAGVDEWSDARAGVRGDWESGGNSLSFTADGNTTRQGQTNVFPTLTPPYNQLVGARYDTSDWNFQGKWERMAGVYKGASLGLSFDHYDRGTTDVAERDTNVAIDFQDPIAISGRLHVIWGTSYKNEQNTIMSNQYVTSTTPTVHMQTYGGFAEAEYDLSSRSRLSLGSKFEHNDYTGWEIQPSARLTYKSGPKNTFWAASSRAVRTPSRADEDLNLFTIGGPGPGGLPIAYHFLGNSNMESEVLVAQELGWRYQPSDRYFIDVAGFYNQYSQLRDALYMGAAPAPNQGPYYIADSTFSNGGWAETGGVELTAHETLTPRWRLEETYSFYTEQYNLGPGDVIGGSSLQQGTTPAHQASIRSNWDLSHQWEINIAGYYTSQLDSVGIEPYARLDLMATWRPKKGTEVSFGVQNLTSTQHLEAPVFLYDVPSQVPRSAFAKITIHF
jgi:iron complex outermembrane receptor protein